MAVSYGGIVPPITPGDPSNTGTGTSIVSQSWTISGTGLVLLVGVRLENHATVVVNSLTWSLGSGSAYEVGTSRLSDCYSSVWAIPAPTAGAGTFTMTLSASVAWDMNADYFLGADQTTPCPLADTTPTSANGAGSPITLTMTPTNVTANDAAWCSSGSALAGGLTSVSPTQTYLWNSATGYRIGVGALDAVYGGTNSGGQATGVGVRIQTPQAAVLLAWMPTTHVVAGPVKDVMIPSGMTP